MKSVVLGKVIENIYSVDPKTEIIVDEHGEEKVVYTAKPLINKETKIKEWKEICHFEGEPRYNHINDMWKVYFASTHNHHCFNISENEEVYVNNEIFRADLNELHLQTDKVIEEIEVNKKEANVELEEHIYKFNKMMNTSNKAMQDYCDLHHLAYWDSDCEKVFSLVYPGKEYEIKDGKMECKIIHTATILGSGYAIAADSYSTAIQSNICDTISSRLSTCTSNIDCTISG